MSYFNDAGLTSVDAVPRSESYRLKAVQIGPTFMHGTGFARVLKTWLGSVFFASAVTQDPQAG